jgi:hypothetical protein
MSRDSNQDGVSSLEQQVCYVTGVSIDLTHGADKGVRLFLFTTGTGMSFEPLSEALLEMVLSVLLWPDSHELYDASPAQRC